MKDVCQILGDDHFQLLFACKDSVHRWTGLEASLAAYSLLWASALHDSLCAMALAS